MYLCCWVRSKLQKAVDLFVLLGCKKNECSSSAWQTANLNEFYVQQQPAATLAASDTEAIIALNLKFNTFFTNRVYLIEIVVFT